MKKILSILLSLLLIGTLCACQVTTPDNTLNTTDISTGPEITNIRDMSDEALLRTMAEGGDCIRCSVSSYITGGSWLSQLMSYSPAFTELVTRPTAVDSINTYLEPLLQEFPNSGIGFMEGYVPLIQEYQAQTDCADLSKLDDQELILRIINNHTQTDWLTFEYFDEHYPLYTFMYLCPEFAELMTRPTALDSIQHYMMLSNVWPSALDWLEPYLPDIEAHITDLK